MSDLPYWLALVRFPKFGARRIKVLSERFPTMKDAFFCSYLDLIDIGIPEKIATQFVHERENISPEKEMKLLSEHGIDAITLFDEKYPPELKQIYDPPAVLFVKGKLPNPYRIHIAVVGSRKPTLYGERVVEELIEPIAKQNAVIVSGLAYGIDALAHQATLRAGGTALAVLGAGLDENNLYPSQHRTLASQIIASDGALISEFPIGTHALKQNFPLRNRIIAGLSKATLVIEAAKKSGSLITAKAALEAGRDVLAVPGPINSALSEGPNNLIKMGAIPVTEANDILSTFGLENHHIEKEYTPASKEEAEIYDILSNKPLHIDEIISVAKLKTSQITSVLTLMEMKGSARHIGGQYYTKG